MGNSYDRWRAFCWCYIPRVRKYFFIFFFAPYNIFWKRYKIHLNHLCLFRRKEVLQHKTFHRYTVRAKRGTAQGLRDSLNRSHAPKSVGAALRRYNEAALVKVRVFSYFLLNIHIYFVSCFYFVAFSKFFLQPYFGRKSFNSI